MPGSQLELVRSGTSPRAAAETSGGVKSILLHVQNDVSLGGRLEAALAAARSCSAHLRCLHVTPIQAYVAFDSFGGVFVMNDVIKSIDEEEARIRRFVEEQLENEDVSWDYEQVTGDIASQIVSHAALADLIVTGRTPHASDIRPAISLLGDILCRSRTPLLVPGDETAAVDFAGRALVAWDGSYEAANAVRSSTGILRLASEVRVLQIKEEKEKAFPGTRLLEYLSRHGIAAELVVEGAIGDYSDQNALAETLSAYAGAMKADYLVMGGYNHSRLGEYVFGGVTRSMLLGSAIPLIIGH